MWKLASCLFLLIPFFGISQFNWTWTELDTMPFRTANNAVCEANVNGAEYVYSFGGIDASKSYSGIHQRSFKYDVSAGSWSEIAQLPDTLGKIAAGASFVKGKIYILGGYHVFANSTELSSNRVHIYNPTTDAYEADGTAIPIPIDDHVQCVYRDSLIFVVTGWSNNGNVPSVQIYNPSLDQWEAGTSTPNSGIFTSFGASGYILGDTLYYHGGTSSFPSFVARRYLRKGYINPNDPTDITWENAGEGPGLAGYRSACSGQGNTVFWVGGSGTAYNFNGIAYNGSGGVEPSTRILHYTNDGTGFTDEVNQPIGMMDFRGIAQLSNNRWIVCGGMDSSQVVSNRTFLLENSVLNVTEQESIQPLKVFYHSNHVTIKSPERNSASLVTIDGKVVQTFEENDTFDIVTSQHSTGLALFVQGNRSILIRLKK